MCRNKHSPRKRFFSLSLPLSALLQHEGKSTVLEVDEGTTILDAALDNDINLPHDCKLGVCLTCPSVVVSGEVDQSDGTLEDSVTAQVGFCRQICHRKPEMFGECACAGLLLLVWSYVVFAVVAVGFASAAILS